MTPPGTTRCSQPPAIPSAIPITAPKPASPSSSAASLPASPPGVARTRKKSTNGSASPSLSPDSRLSVWRICAGTRCAVTTVEVTTGSVGESTAPSRNASAQLRSGNSSFAAERQQAEGDRHRDHQRPRRRAPVAAEQLAVDDEPVGDQGQDQRQLDQLEHAGVGDVDLDHVGEPASTIPSVTESTEIESTVPRITPRERRRDREQGADDQQRLAEAELHQRPRTSRRSRRSTSPARGSARRRWRRARRGGRPSRRRAAGPRAAAPRPWR